MLPLVGCDVRRLQAAARGCTAATWWSVRTQGGGQAEGAYAIKLAGGVPRRRVRIIRAQPWTGIGFGNFESWSLAIGTYTDDPAQSSSARGCRGWLPALGSLRGPRHRHERLLVLRRASYFSLPTALAVQAWLLTHAMVDVYWVRGTPEVGWLLVGAALAATTEVSQPRMTELAVVLVAYGAPDLVRGPLSSRWPGCPSSSSTTPLIARVRVEADGSRQLPRPRHQPRLRRGVNRGLDEVSRTHPEADVLLLNPDAVVEAGTARRAGAPALHARPRTAAVSPHW